MDVDHNVVGQLENGARSPDDQLPAVDDVAIAAPAAPPTKIRLRQLFRLWQEDWARNGHAWSRPGFQALACHRFGVWAAGLPQPARALANILYSTAYMFIRNTYGIELPRTAHVGRRLFIPHHPGIIVAPNTRIGDDCLIRQNVTLGAYNRGRRRRPPYTPRIGNGVEVGAGAVVVGGLTVGDGARIGPNAVVTTDVPAGGSAFAPPTRVMPPLTEKRPG